MVPWWRAFVAVVDIYLIAIDSPVTLLAAAIPYAMRKALFDSQGDFCSW